MTTRRSLSGRIAAAFAVALFAASCGSTEYEYPTLPVPTPEQPPAGYVWSELPAGAVETVPSGRQLITHYETFGGKYGRSFTMMYDLTEKVSYWVAYPMHNIYFKTGGVRTNNFRYDPKVSATQMPITGTSGYGLSGYQRGHQIASADRNRNETQNDQTFYVTNMTPQNGTLNEGQWADLEAWVRGRASQGGRHDTLYVVTGCVLTTKDDPTVRRFKKNGVEGAIPKAYYKVLLRSKSGNPVFPKNSDYQCIGFWMENKVPTDTWGEYVKSVAEIEDLTGETFFPALSRASKAKYTVADWGGIN